MSGLVEAKRIVVLLVVLMAAVVALSGPVAEVLDPGSEPVAEAKKKHKKKKKKKKKNRRPTFNVVQCPTERDFICNGSEGNDFLIGGPEDRPDGAFDQIQGGEGTDVFNGGNGSDFLFDFSETSSDYYLFPDTPFSGDFGAQAAIVFDEGGDGDVVDLSSYSVVEFDVSRFEGDALLLDGPGERDIEIDEFFDGVGKTEYFLFREGYFTGDQIAGSAAQATPEEQAALKERFDEVENSSGEAAKQEDASP